MPVNRNRDARIRYQRTVRENKRSMIQDAQCDEAFLVGLLRIYMTMDFEDLRHIRERPARTRGQKVKRKADFYFVLARMAERGDTIDQLLS